MEVLIVIVSSGTITGSVSFVCGVHSVILGAISRFSDRTHAFQLFFTVKTYLIGFETTMVADYVKYLLLKKKKRKEKKRKKNQTNSFSKLLSFIRCAFGS